jgi:hypothetical protein
MTSPSTPINVIIVWPRQHQNGSQRTDGARGRHRAQFFSALRSGVLFTPVNAPLRISQRRTRCSTSMLTQSAWLSSGLGLIACTPFEKAQGTGLSRHSTQSRLMSRWRQVDEGVKAELEAISERRKLEMAEFDAEREAQRDKAVFQRMLRSARDEALWLEQRPKVVADIRSGAATLRETSARMRMNRLRRRES